MGKKDFKASPAMSFISQETIAKKEQKKTAPAAGIGKPPEGYKVNPAFIETKSRRINILLQPSIHEAIKEKARAAGISTNEAINQALKEYTGRA